MNAIKNKNSCVVCDKSFAQVQGLYRHQRQKHGMDRQKLLKCDHCSLQFSTKCRLIVHAKSHRKIITRIRCAWSSCEEMFPNYKSYRCHLEKQHSYTLKEEKLRFENEEKFHEWKMQIEEQLKVKFVQDTSGKMVKNMKRLYFICHRSLFPRQKLNPKRHPKNIGSNKIERACPAMIIASIEDVVIVHYFPTHLGHDCEIGRTYLSQNDRNRLAGKLLEGVTIQRVLDDVRKEAATTGSVERRIHLLEKKDLHNIKRDFDISYTTKLHENDAVSVKLWVEQMRQQNGDSCEVLYYKEQGQPPDESDNFLLNDDFVLIIMTEFQQNMMHKYGSDKICIDGTHGLNAYNFQLYTVMVVDEFGHGVPAAFCFSNRSDIEVFRLYFNCIRNRVGVVNANVFMSDDAPAFYNAWCSIMGPVNNQLMCTWHVNRNWFQNLNKITGPNCADKKKLVFKTLKVLQKEVDEDKFLTGLNTFMDDLKNDPDTITFGEYFLKTYCNRIPKWAYYARKYLGINTNMYLEALHKKIKYTYLEGKQCKRLDRSINSLLVLVRDSAFERIIKFSKNKLSAKNLKIRESHNRSSDIIESMIHTVVENKKWQVASSKSLSVMYLVEKMEDDACRSKNCSLRCFVCKICVHNFKCTCLDNVISFNICKHIHSVLTLENSLQQNVSLPELDKSDEENKPVPSTSLHITQHTPNEIPEGKYNELKAKCELLIGLCARSSLDNNSYDKISKLLDTAISEANKGQVNFVQKVPKVNVSKKIELQCRFSSKSKRKQGSTQPHPSEIDQSIIQESLSQGDSSRVLYIHDGSDHSYV